jgi:GntR family transcriptional regulator
VAGPKFVQPLELSSYTEGVRRQGGRPGRQLVALEELPAGPFLAPLLRIPEESEVIHLERLLLADDERIGLESTYMPSSLLPTLIDRFDPTTSLYAFLREAGVVIAEADERIETVLASPRESALIGTSPALPMLLFNRASRDPHGQPIECVRTLYRGDRFSFTTHLT